jgi:3-dehydroquinate synthase
VIAIGGGAVLDLVGYVAATVHRGVRLIRIPTTVLSQNDVGVGVKNGINALGVKNSIGTFCPPFAVINDFDLLRSLDRRDKRAGYAEAVKVSLIRDPAFFDWLEANALALQAFEPHAMAYMIRVCAKHHMQHIATSGDPFEMGSARPLDYGHWAAHKLENLTRYALRHGEAVAIGIALDTRYAVETGLLSSEQALRVVCLFEQLGFKLWHPALEARHSDSDHFTFLDGLEEFREHLGGELTIPLLRAIGSPIDVYELDTDRVLRARQWLKERDAQRQN